MALQRGDVGPLVLALQVLLRITRTGVFDAKTELAVVHLQQDFGLVVDGIADTAEYDAARHASSHATAGADPVTLDQSQITGLPTDLAAKVNRSGDTMTGALVLSNGANLELSGADALGEGCIVFTGAASALYDSNVCRTDSTAKTMGYVCGATAAFAGAYGPFFGLRGNTYAAYANQRGNIFLYGGKPSAPGALEGRVILGTNDTERLTISYGGTVAVAGALTVGASIAIGGGTAISQVRVYTPNLTPAAVDTADGYVEQIFTVTGLSTSDTIAVNQPAMAASTHCQLVAFRVSAANTLALTFHSVSGSHSPPAGVYRVIAYRS